MTNENKTTTGTGLKAFVEKETPENMERTTIEDLIAYLHTLPELPEPRLIEKMFIPELRNRISTRNQTADKSDQWSKPARMSPAAIANIMLEFDHVVMLSMTETGTPSRENASLHIYCDHGELEGTYTDDENIIGARIDAYSDKLNRSEFDLVIKYLQRHAKLVRLTMDANLVAVNNGIFDYAAKTLLPFTPDKYFKTKLATRYVDGAPNQYITMPDGEVWDCDSQMESMAADDEQLHFHWQVLSAACRPHADYGKAIFPYSETGNNGKGTFCSIVRNIIGTDACLNMSLADMSDDSFALAGIRNGKTCIIGDENPVGTCIDRSSAFKSLCTSDPVFVNQKYKTAISVVYHGLILQCLNELPRVNDRSNSYLRRVIFDPFTAEFEGIERPYIKNDYLKRPEVLEYYLYKALNMDFDEYAVPQICQDAMEHYKVFNDPIREFWSDVEDRLVWDWQPTVWLYELYKAWFASTHPNGIAIAKNRFWQQLLQVIDKTKWQVATSEARVNNLNTNVNHMDGHEQLIADYNVTKYMSDTYTGPDVQKRCAFTRPEKVRQRLEKIGD